MSAHNPYRDWTEPRPISVVVALAASILGLLVLPDRFSTAAIIIPPALQFAYMLTCFFAAMIKFDLEQRSSTSKADRRSIEPDSGLVP